MKKSLRIGLLGLLTGATAFAGALSLNAQKAEIASADANFTMEMENGAAVRLVGTDEKEYGIKYTAKLASYDTDAKYYVMIIPTGWLTRYGLSESYDATCDYYGTLSAQADIADRLMTMEATPQYVEEDDCYYFEGSIKTVKYENSFREYFGIAYSEKNGVRTYAEFETGENVRSVSQVASAALNDKTENWTDTQKASLKKMVQTAYNAKNDDDYTTVENATLPTISATKDELSLVSGNTHQIDTLTGISALEDIGVKVQYTSSSPAQVTVSESGMLSANTVGSGATITATVLGEDYEVAEIAPVENMLVGFDTKESEDNIVKISTTYTYLNSENQDVFAAEWQESFAGRNGVVKTVTTNGGAYKEHKIYPLFDKTVAQMQALDFDYISIWIYVDAEGMYDARSYLHVLNTVEGGKWQEIRLTKEDITHAESDKNSYWVQNFPSTIWTHFNEDYVKENGAVTELFQLLGKEKNADPITVYIDSISYAKFDGEFNAPEKVGEFTLPNVTMNNNTATVTVSKGTDEITVESGKATLPYAGDYTVAYECAYNGLNYTQEFNFSVARADMAANMLEDFDDPVSANNIGVGKLGNGEWVESVTIGGVEKKGVIKCVTTGSEANYGNRIYARFNMTSEELLDLEFDYITFNFFAYKHNNLTDRWITLNICGVSSGMGYNRPEATTLDTVFSKGQWVEKQITKDQLIDYAKNNDRYSSIASGDDLANFFALHDNSGSGNYLITTSTVAETFYIDSITFGKNA